MSGGGRCNFTNLNCSSDDFISRNPRFCISALSRFTAHDFVALVERHEIAYHEKTAGQLFCNFSSKDILAMLVRECDQAGVIIRTDCDISTVSYADGYRLHSNIGQHDCQSLVVATGGLSIPKMGASDFGYRLARQFGLNVWPTIAGLVPYIFTGQLQGLSKRLSGISTGATISVGSESFNDDILFTHRGLSGPAALQSSNHWVPGREITIDLLPEIDVTKLLLEAKSQQPQLLLRTVLSDHLPRALVLELEKKWWSTMSEERIAEFRDERLRDIATHVAAWRLKPSGTEGYRTAEVTLGGVDTRSLSSQTMECVQQPGLYFIGEVVDVTGQLGGYNFQWAWSSGQAAGRIA
jgi:predicted Rossmann fold flavoprotein